jgi:hypothetical protein
MNRMAEIGGIAVTSDLRSHNLDMYIKQCNECALTCRSWAETFAGGGGGKVAATIDTCLDCARVCELLSRAFSLNKEGVKNVHPLQIEACMMACRACSHQCDKESDKFDGLSICADSARKCEELLRMLIRPKSMKSRESRVFSVFKNIRVFRMSK